jgi:predicted phosphodiesterase
MSSIARKSNVLNGIKIALFVFSLFLTYPVLAIAYSDTNLSSNQVIESSMGATIAFFGDSEPASSSDVTEITEDLNQVIPHSPTGKVDAIFFMGDMTKLSLTLQAVAASNVKNVPVYFVMGNHEAQSSSETAIIQGRYSNSIFPLNPGPAGTDKTTYSMNVGNIHLINMNEYWDGATDDSYLKYSSNDGGYVPDALYNWMSTDLSNTSDWKIIVGHDPLYPVSRHVGNSLDADKANRNKLQALFVSKNVSIFFGGHTHIAGVQIIDGVYHVSTGVIGSGAGGSGDEFASISYAYSTANNLTLTWKHEDPNWNSPTTESYTISKVTSSNSPINITSYAPLSPIIDTEGAARTFNLIADQTLNVEWYINGTLVGSNSSVIAANYSNDSAKSGTWNVSAIANNSNDSAIQTWIWKVSDPIVSGSFINGTVMDSVSKSGLAEVEVLTDRGLSTKTNATGFYSFEVTPETTYTLMAAFEPMYYPNSTTVSTSWVVLQDIELLKKPNGTITGKINIS